MDIRVDFEMTGRFAHELRPMETLENRFECFQRYMFEQGFDGATYTFMPKFQEKPLSDFSPVFVNTDEYPVKFLGHYQEAGFVQHDFTVKQAHAGRTDVMVWPDYLYSGKLSADEANVLTVAREDYGIKQGLTVPTMSNGKGIAGVSLISTENDRLFQKLRAERLGTMVELAHIFHKFVLADRQTTTEMSDPVFDRLSEKEVGLLCHMARGKPFKNIGYSIDVASPKVAYNMLKSIRDKFGGVNSDRLMYLAGMYKLLDRE